MKKSGVLLKALVISGLMVINGQSAVLSDIRQLNEISRDLIFYQNGLGKSVNAEAICIPGTWTGVTNSDWNTATNWCDGVTPTSTTNVSIPSGVPSPVIGSEAYCKNLIIQAGARLTISDSHVLTISGDFLNNGIFSKNQSTVIFNGDNQIVGKGPFYNLTFRGKGIKTIAILAEAFYHGLLSMEEMATVSSKPYPAPTSSLQYNTSSPRITGLEWPQTFTANGVTIKNSGMITINELKTLTIKSGEIVYRCGLTVDENATLNLNTFNIQYPETVNLKCGGGEKGSSIIGTGILYLMDTKLNVTDAGHGTAGALVTCPVDMSLTNTFNIGNDDPNVFTDDDLTISMISNGGTLSKSGFGTLNLGASNMNVNSFNIDQGRVTVPVGSQIDVYVKISVLPANGLNIESNTSGSGSLIAYAALGTATIERYMTPGAWHIVSSPVSGQLISGFLTSNGSIPTDEYFNRGMRDYNPDLNLWNDFFTNGTSGALTTGKGYCMRVRTSQDHKVNFAGTLQAGDLTVLGLTAEKWNCIGNPYTSAIKINSETFSYVFLKANSANLDPLYGAVYIWDQPDAGNGNADNYTIVSNASPPCEVQLGQAFMVKMAKGKTSVNFKYTMQVHNTTVALKSTDGIWPTIKLIATADSITSSTIVAFQEEMTPGLDPTYDAGLLKARDDMSLYTFLVENEDIPFAIQALPDNYESTIVPVGLDCPKGGQVTFSAELLNVPSSCKAILEDRLNQVLSDLSVHSYTTDLKEGTSVQGRFFLHTSYTTTGIDSHNKIQNLKAWVDSNQEIKIRGEVGSKATVILYDTQGRMILTEKLKAGLIHTIRLPDIKAGIYILLVKEMEHQQVLKLVVEE